MKRRNTKGFTLGEVLLVVAIISALTAIGIPSLMREIDKAKLRVDQAHVQEAVSMATSQYAADHESVTVVYYYDANRSEIQKENRNIYGYGKSTKEPYKHNTHVTDSTVPVNDDGTRNLVRVTVTKQSGEFSIESSWVPAAVNGETPPPTSTPVTTPDPNKKTFGDVEITAAGSWPLKGEGKDFPTANVEPYVRIQYGYVYTYNNEFYLVKDPNNQHLNMNWYNWYPPDPPDPLEGRNATVKLSSSMFDKVYTQEEFENKFSGAPYNKHIEGNKYVFKANDGVLYFVITEYPFNSDGKIAADLLKDTGRFCPIYGAVLKRK